MPKRKDVGSLPGFNDSSSEDNAHLSRSIGSNLLEGADSSKRFRRRRVPREVWKRFTPNDVSSNKCCARVWGDGYGGQCQRAPVDGRTLCVYHAGQGRAVYGLVTGDIPYGKLQEFLRKSRAEHYYGNLYG